MLNAALVVLLRISPIYIARVAGSKDSLQQPAIVLWWVALGLHKTSTT